MKIVFIDTYPIRRGAQVFVTELADYLEQNGQETSRIYLYRPEQNAAAVELRIQDKCLGFNPNHLFEKVPSIHPRLLRILVAEIRKADPDIVLLNGSRTLKYGALAKQLSLRSIKWISRVIDNAEYWNTSTFTHWYYRKLVMPNMDGAVGVSRASLESMTRHYGFRKPTRVIHRVFDPQKFQKAPSRKEARERLGLDEDEEVLLFLGNLTAQKRPDRFVEIVDELTKRGRNVRGILVGDGELRGELERKVAGIKYQVSSTEYQEARVERREPRDERREPKDESQVSSSKYLVSSIKSQESRIGSQENDESGVLCLTTRVSFLGYQQDVAPFLAAADLLILPSDTEGLPGVVLEAAYFSLPTVATEVGGIRECLIDGKTGVLIPERSVSQFCKEISFLLDRPERRKEMGAAAKAFVDENFRMEVAGQQYLDFFRLLLSSK